ncbi:hypothetical protein SCUCBS95973_002962 [Sporothrix curviconia]|uniref:xylan 1,4-beta-xylosidase n=1 Tax=Sporothrix curviconia TaxID=1260050 RepID=A0ABP0BBM8_9PEZI
MAPVVALLPLLALLGLPAARAGLVYPDCANGPLKGNLACNTSASAHDRAVALVAAMSNADQLSNLVNNSPGFAKLGLAAYQWWNEALHGVAHNRGITWASSGAFSAATQFPQAITSGAAFDDELIRQIGAAIGTEARAFANSGRAHLDFWTPNVNPFRDPRWGRGHETPGEDALRNGRFGEAYVRGMQGADELDPSGPDDPEGRAKEKRHRVIATCKHFAAYDLEDAGGGGGSVTRFNFDAKVTLQDLAEYYLPPFQKCARDARAGSVMCSYNAVNGVPACANAYLLDTVLRGHWNWTAHGEYVVSDCDAVYYLGSAAGGHRYKASHAAAVGAAFEAGVDNICWASDGAAPSPSQAFSQKLFAQATLDRMLERQFEGLVRTGLLDGPQGAYRSLGAGDVNTPAARALALRAAEAGLVLLKNDGGVLPLALAKSGSGGTIAMLGFWAAKADEMLGGYSGTPPFSHDPVTAARQMGLTVKTVASTAAAGPAGQGAGAGDTSAMVAAAKNAAAIVYFGGIDNTVEKEGSDRSSIAWPAGQLAQIKALAALGTAPIIVVKMGTHVDDTPLLALPGVKAIVWAGYPGQDGGTAVMNVLLGKTVPAGRLPMTMYPAAYIRDAPMTNMALRPGSSSSSYPGRTYRWFDKAVFPFGHGLHYTNFSVALGGAALSAPLSIQALVARCTDAVLDRCPFPDLAVNVTNTGSVASDYVALAFVRGTYGPAPYPIKTLAAYTRLANVTAGETQAAVLTWSLGDLARVDTSGNRVLYPGNYTVLLDQPALATFSFALTGTEAILDQWPQPT